MDVTSQTPAELRSLLLQVCDTLDAIGVEGGDLAVRLAFLRGAAVGLRPLASGRRARKVEAAEVRAERQHDPSWPAARRAFFAALGELGIHDRYEVIAAFCESRSLPRPSQMDLKQRDTFLGKMANEDSRARYHEWVGAHGASVGHEIEEAA